MRLRTILFSLFLALTLFVSDDCFAQRGRFFLSTVQNQQVVLDEDYQAVLTYATGQGYSLPSSGQQILQNQLVLDLKAAGIWTLLDVFYVFATDGDSDFATLNWKSPTLFQALKVNSPTFTSNQGFTGNASTSYINTTFSPVDGTNLTQNDAGAGIHVNDNSTVANPFDFGSHNSGVSLFIFQARRGTGDNLSVSNILSQSSGINQTNVNAVGFYHLKRTSASSVQVHKNGNVFGTNNSSTSSAPPIFDFYVGGRNVNGSLNAPSPRQISMWWAGASLSGLESAFYTAWNTYFTSL